MSKASIGNDTLSPHQIQQDDSALNTVAKERAEWVDIAKAISIILVVLWHSAGVDWLPNRLAFFIRMPLFFCVAGFFAANAIRSPWHHLIKSKVSHFVYLYAVWVTIGFVFISVAFALFSGRWPDPIPYFQSFYKPALTLWFLYALAIMFPLAKIFSKLPVCLLIPALILLYILSATSGEWTWGSFPDRIARLSIMFAIGALGYNNIAVVSARWRTWWPATLLLYCIGSYLIFSYNLMGAPVIALAMNGLGVWSIILFARSVAEFSHIHILKRIGQGTLFIYVLHRILLFYSDIFFKELRLPDTNFFEIVQAIAVIPIAFVAGKYLNKAFPWLFEAPWLKKAKPGSIGNRITA